MAASNDELGRLWGRDGGRQCDRAALVAEVERRAQGFERTIRHRDLREAVGGAVVAVLFLWMAAHDRSALERAGHLWVAGCGIWVVVYMRRFARAAGQPVVHQTLAAYQEELMERYQRQIRLLKSAKYWYVLPFWLGLVVSVAGTAIRIGSVAAFAIGAVPVTLISLGLWWLNEGPGVRHLEGQRRQLLALTGSEGEAR
jgi:hypothetical protein